jgi:hypothetical protein
MSPSGHLIVLKKDESDKVNGIKALGEVLLASIPNEKVKFIFTPADAADKLKEKHGVYMGFNKSSLDKVIIPHPWVTQETFVRNVLPEIMILTAKERGLAEPRYKTLEEFQQAVKKTEEKSKEHDIACMRDDDWKVVNMN